ncbi:type ISP restriction/modification enzyme [Naumannella halotolerans]|uniref:site-specific DNA-methyltransferase (adenine-specific) n=1 Tax=Naumannella halotolerans TaxID=993414 RepID=A0A4R7J2N6_9ACTN|nr:type ISP restriction/modification enzyme [Naumannella halotolerans]TDT31354.1 N-6 DNA methylase [Naumannella halotolerans]
MAPPTNLQTATAEYGKAAKAKLLSPAVSGQAEDQLRGPIENYLRALTGLGGQDTDALVLVGESALSELQVRPDFAVTLSGVLVGFVELKAPGKGADPRRFTDKHDKNQWAKLSALPNLMYTDGNEFSVWRFGELQGTVQKLDGDVNISGSKLEAPTGLPGLVADFLTWSPQPPARPSQLAHTAARLCRLLRDEVTEQLTAKNSDLLGLAYDWRQLLFPDASDEEFADSYAQAVTFGLLMARVRNIDLTDGVAAAATKLAAEKYTLVGTALRILTEGQLAHDALQTSVATLTRTLSVVDWPKLSKGNPEAWLYFYEEFLAEYDPELRKKTGSYYTPVEVVSEMTRLVDEALVSRLNISGGLADPGVKVLDPALGTGTYLLEVLRRIAEHVSDEQGPGAVPGALADTVSRIIGFELQMGPYAVAQLRLLAELNELHAPDSALSGLRTYVTNTLDDPLVEVTKLGNWYEPIAQSRRDANEVKAKEPVMVVLGNPPYKERSKGQGGFVEQGGVSRPAPLRRFIPDPQVGVGAHVKHLYNPYVYFWRWATDKVFDQPLEDGGIDDGRGIVCFITVAGFLGGPGFSQMRAYLRERADAVYIIDCSPEGHQPPHSTRIFQGVQQPICITLAVRDGSTGDGPATVYYRSLQSGPRKEKFVELKSISLDAADADSGWELAGTSPYDPFWPAAAAEWSSYPSLEDLFLYDGSGTMLGRTWPVAPDRQTLTDRWNAFTGAPQGRKPELLQEHADRTVNTELSDGLPGYPAPANSIGSETGPVPQPVRYGYRSLDRQWIIPDKRLINRPNPTLWRVYGDSQVYLTAFTRNSPGNVAASFSAHIPDLDHYQGSFGGRVWPMWRDAAGTIANTTPNLLTALSDRLSQSVQGPDVMAYVAGIVSHPAYATKFSDDLESPGIRVPVVADADLFNEAVELGRRVIWLHSYGTRFVSAEAGRPPGSPRLPADRAPKVLAEYPIPADAEGMPDEITFDPDHHRLYIGAGQIGPVVPEVWNYSVGNREIIQQWFSYRRRDRHRPAMGARRNSPLSDLQVDHWLPEYTTDLIDLLHVLTLLTEVHTEQAELLDAIIARSNFVTVTDLTVAGVLPVSADIRKKAGKPTTGAEVPSDPDTLFG